MAIFNKPIRLSASIIPLTLLLQGCVTNPIVRRIEVTATVLEQREDADLLAAAGLLRSSEGKPALAVDLLTRATAVAPERADLAWLKIQICREVSTCDSGPEEMRLRVLDPSNGAGWLNALARADASKDEDARIAVLKALSRAERVDFYWTALVVHLTNAIADTQKVPLPEALIDVLGVLAAEAIPAYGNTSNLCKGDRLNSAEVIADCRGVALAFEQEDTNITDMIGVVIAKRVWPADSVEWKAATEERRVYEYRFRLSMQSASHLRFDTPWAEQFLARCAQNRREHDVLRAELVDKGKNPDPPPDWVP